VLMVVTVRPCEQKKMLDVSGAIQQLLIFLVLARLFEVISEFCLLISNPKADLPLLLFVVLGHQLL